MRVYFPWLICVAMIFAALSLSAAPILPEAPVVLAFDKANMVPLPPLLAIFQAEMLLKGDTVTVSRAGKTMEMIIAKRDARQNGKKLKLPAAPFMQAGITYVPLEALLKALGGKATLAADKQHFLVSLPGSGELHLPVVKQEGEATGFRKEDSEIFLVNVDGGTVQQLTHNIVDEMLVQFSADGLAMVYNNGMDIWSRQFNSPVGINLTKPFSDIGIASAAVQSAPDGTLWFMQAVLEGENAQDIPDICRMKQDGSDFRRVTSGINPLISRDGKVICFTTQNPDGEPAVYAMLPDGTNLRELADGMLDACSPDGSYVTVQQQSRAEEKAPVSFAGINVADGTVKFPLNVAAENHEAFSSISPDGSKIVYLQQDSGIWVMDADRKNPIQLTDDVEDWAPKISPDGKVIFTRNNSLYMVPLAGGEAMPLTPGYLIRDFAFYADGAQILFTGISQQARDLLVAPPLEPNLGKYTPPTEDEVAAAAKAGTRQATIDTTKGKIVLELYGADAPLTVANFIKLVKAGYYKGLTFHRVVPGFVIQGGDPKGDGSGGPGYEIKLEISPKLRHVTGALAMARSMEPDSAGSQFYITLEENENTRGLDDNYAVFGKVISGMNVALKISQGDKINSITIK